MNDPTRPTRAIPLPFLGVLRVSGADALTFLQGQLTNDVRVLADGRTQLAALNTPQGRVVALPRLRLIGDAVFALLPTELLEPVRTLLRRFVLRSKVQLQQASDLQVGWIDAGASPLGAGLAGRNASATASATIDGPVDNVVAFDYARGRRVLAAPAAAWSAITESAPMQTPPAIEDEWRAMDIHAGLPQICAVTSGVFVPQMLNLDLLDAISFSKGCYTGQEIVARTQHLGRIKRRLLHYRLSPGPAPAPLAGLYLDASKVAEILMSASRDDGVHVLAVTSLEALGSRLRSEEGREAEPVDLPYAVNDGRRS
jgi:folate-binding protein YgfZ